MKLVNNINFRVFSNPEENKEAIRNALLLLAGYTQEQLSEEKIKYKEINAKGFRQRIIVITEITFEKERHCNKFLKGLMSFFPPRIKIF
jgi:RNA binding exosome subunit